MDAKQILRTQRGNLIVIENHAFIDLVTGANPGVRFKNIAGIAPGYVIENYDTIALAWSAREVIYAALKQGQLFTDVYVPVSVSGISPGTSGTGGGATIVLSGINLSKDGSTVKIGGTPATLVSINKALTQLTFTTPAKAAGTYDVVYSSYATPDLTLSNAIVYS